jgi:AraC-like DNA-binding protein
MKEIPIRKINTPQKELNSSESFSIRHIPDLLAGKDMVQALHRHDFFYILALKKGKGDHEIDFTSYKISNHSVFFMRPGQVHQIKLKAGSTGYLLEFKTDFYHQDNAAQLLRKASSMNVYQSDANKSKKLFSILTEIFHEYANKQESYQEVIKANLRIFFIELCRQRQIRSKRVNMYAQELFEALLERLETHITKHKKVSEYADMLSLSAYQLNAVTKTMIGKTCSELIDEHIILESKRHLLATSNQINQIAYQLGYDDVSYFIRFFKKHTGYSPETFRNNFR